MSYKTGEEIRDYIVRSFNRTDKDTELYEALTDTIRDIRRKHPFEEDSEIAYTSGTVSDGEYNFALPSDFNHLVGDIKILEDTSSYVLNKISKQKYDELEPHPEYPSRDKAKPTKYAIYSDQVFLYPVPDETSYEYEFNYATDDESDITSSTSEVPYSNKHREILKHGVLARLYEGLELYQESELFWQKYELGVQEMIDREYDNLDAPTFTEYNGI